jgi:organic radical activating enzyme
MNQVAAPILEIFPSVQGEGLLVGMPQIFLRLGRCNLRCTYCDTPESIGDPPATMRHILQIGASPSEHPNPMTATSAAGLVMATAAHVPVARMVSITGGEPLLHEEFLHELMSILRARGMRLMLETSGLLAAPFSRLAGLLDVASIDLKLPAETGMPLSKLVEKHAEFLAAATPVPLVYCKIVVTETTSNSDLAALSDTLGGSPVAERAVLYLTPVTTVPDGPRPPRLPRLLELAALCRRRLRDVRVLPQVHPLAGWA